MNFKERLMRCSEINNESEDNIPSGYQQIGDIILMKFRDNVGLETKKKIAKSILSLLTYANTICEIKKIKGELRVPEIKILASRIKRKNLETIHRENGILYMLDVSKIMFSKGNLFERSRLVSQIKPGEVVVDMFAGIGYFSLGIAKFSSAARIISIEKNPVAFRYLKKNILLNETGKIIPVRGDCRMVAKKLQRKADRIIMGYFPGTNKFLPSAFVMLKDRGIIHYHNLYHEKDLWSKPLYDIEKASKESGFHIFSIIGRNIVKSYSPSLRHVVIDAEFERVR